MNALLQAIAMAAAAEWAKMFAWTGNVQFYPVEPNKAPVGGYSASWFQCTACGVWTQWGTYHTCQTIWTSVP